MNDLINIIYRPGFEFKAVKNSQVNYIIVMLILVLLTIIHAVVFLPIQSQLMAHNDVFANMPPEQAEKAKSIGESMKYIGIIMAGVLFIIKILVQALMVWGGVALFKGIMNFKQSLLVVSLVSFIFILGDFVNVGIIFYTGIENVTSMADISKTGLNLFFNPENIGMPLYAFLAYINPFQVWGIIIMIAGLMIIGEMQWSNATILCLILWLIWVAFPVFGVVMSEAATSRAGF